MDLKEAREVLHAWLRTANIADARNQQAACVVLAELDRLTAEREREDRLLRANLTLSIWEGFWCWERPNWYEPWIVRGNDRAEVAKLAESKL